MMYWSIQPCSVTHAHTIIVAAHTLKKLVPETCASCLVQETCIRETCTCVSQSCTSFFLVQVSRHTIAHSSISCQKLSGTWLDPCNV